MTSAGRTSRLGTPPYQTWVNNWFVASDVMGLSNVLYVGSSPQEGFGSPWVNSLIGIDPTVATYYSNGTRAAYVSLDNPEVARYLESDLTMLYSYYGTYPSWVGLGTGSSQSNPYYALGGSVPIIGYSNVSITSFVNSPYYNADVNGTGYLPNGKLDALWSEYRDVQPAIVLSSGIVDDIHTLSGIRKRELDQFRRDAIRHPREHDDAPGEVVRQFGRKPRGPQHDDIRGQERWPRLQQEAR